jgi:cytochrome c6
MKKRILVAAILIPILVCPTSATEGLAAANGESLFMKHCNVCHAKGGNIINPPKTLMQNDLQANGMNTIEALVKNMRNPGPGMIPFDEKKVSDTEAIAIAEYILKTFK